MNEGVVRRFLYYPDPLPAEMPPPPWAEGAEEVWIGTWDGLRIHGLWWGKPVKRPVILFLHGNAQEVYSWSPVRRELEALECRMLLVDYRGYGKSEGAPDEQGLYSDGRAALGWLASEGVEGGMTVVFGKSLGGAVACEISRGRELLGLVLESTFTSLASVARHLFPFTPRYTPPAGCYNSLEKLPEIKCPALFIHGERDTLIPASEGTALFEAFSGRKELFLVPGAGHNDVSMVAGSEYGTRIRRWLDGLSGPVL